MGEIWFGYDKRLDRRIAMKFIRVDRLPDGKPDAELVQRFVRESRITARLEHPGVPAVYDCGTRGDDLYLVMQLIDGCSIADLLAEIDRVPVPWAAAIAAQVCAVLAVAHAHSLVHRDLKPSNLMLCPDGAVKVLDFGVAAALSPTATRITKTGIAVGTPEYMAPEQALAGTTSPQSDLYSLGVVLDEMLTGENQFAAATPLASMRNHLDHTPRDPRSRFREIPDELARLVLWLLAKTPDERPSSAMAVYRHLAEFCRDLPPLPGYVNSAELHPAGMYAAIVGRVGYPAGAGGGPAPPVPTAPVPTGDSAPATSPPVASSLGASAGPGSPPGRPAALGAGEITHADIALARKDVQMLKAESRFSQAAEMLAEVVGQAGRAWGAKHTDVIELRIELADVLFLGGDYRRAAPEFAALATDLAEREGPDNDLVLRFRLMEANCHAAVGETSLALSRLGGLLADERRFGVDEDRILELRRQIGLLELGSGDRAKARATLRAVAADLEARYGSAHPHVEKIKEILGDLKGEA
jgi:hypothetical protein